MSGLVTGLASALIPLGVNLISKLFGSNQKDNEFAVLKAGKMLTKSKTKDSLRRKYLKFKKTKLGSGLIIENDNVQAMKDELARKLKIVNMGKLVTKPGIVEEIESAEKSLEEAVLIKKYEVPPPELSSSEAINKRVRDKLLGDNKDDNLLKKLNELPDEIVNKFFEKVQTLNINKLASLISEIEKAKSRKVVIDIITEDVREYNDIGDSNSNIMVPTKEDPLSTVNSINPAIPSKIQVKEIKAVVKDLAENPESINFVGPVRLVKSNNFNDDIPYLEDTGDSNSNQDAIIEEYIKDKKKSSKQKGLMKKSENAANAIIKTYNLQDEALKQESEVSDMSISEGDNADDEDEGYHSLEDTNESNNVKPLPLSTKLSIDQFNEFIKDNKIPKNIGVYSLDEGKLWKDLHGYAAENPAMNSPIRNEGINENIQKKIDLIYYLSSLQDSDIALIFNMLKYSNHYERSYRNYINEYLAKYRGIKFPVTIENKLDKYNEISPFGKITLYKLNNFNPLILPANIKDLLNKDPSLQKNIVNSKAPKTRSSTPIPTIRSSTPVPKSKRVIKNGGNKKTNKRMLVDVTVLK